MRSKIKQFTAWSYSRYRDYKKCPFFAKCKHLDKLPEGPASPQMARGTQIHKIAEDYVRGAIKVFPTELSLLKKHFMAARKVPGVLVEEQWCFDSQWGQREWNDWSNVWLRVKMDLHVIDRPTNVLVVVDHKTGKYREYELGSYEEQLEIYALGGLVKYPDVVGVSPRMWYLDEGITHGDDYYYPRSDQKRLTKLWLQRIQPMFTDTRFKPRPNDKCKWCFYRKENGGPCAY